MSENECVEGRVVNFIETERNTDWEAGRNAWTTRRLLFWSLLSGTYRIGKWRSC